MGDDGTIWYELQTDNVAGLQQTVTVPAREIIHDRANTLHHSLVGLSTIYACGLAATNSLAMQNSSTRLFQNAARPGGLLVAPGRIDPENAKRLKEAWDADFSGDKVGRVAVLGDGLKYEALTLTAKESQLIDQLKWSAMVVASVFHVPENMVGVSFPLLGGPESVLGFGLNEESSGEEAQAGGDHRQAA